MTRFIMDSKKVKREQLGNVLTRRTVRGERNAEK